LEARKVDSNADMEQESGGNGKLNSVYLEGNKKRNKWKIKKKSQPSWTTIN